MPISSVLQARMTRLVLPLFVSVVGLFSTPSTAQPTVSSVTPTAQTINAPVNSDVVVQFTAAINPATVNAASFRIFGRWSGPASGTITFEDSNRRVRFNPSDDFFAGEWVTVSLSKSVQDAGGNPLATGYVWNFWTRTLPGSLNLSLTGSQTIREGNELNITSYGAYAGDFDNDGWSDLMVPNENTNDVRVFMNDEGDFGPFEHKIDTDSDGRPSPNEGADFNNDGNIDVAVAAILSSDIAVLLGNGTGAFPSVNLYAVNEYDVRGLCVADYDADGDEDILVTARNGSDLEVLENNGSGVFTYGDAFDTQLSRVTSCAVADINEDGIHDVFVGSFDSREIAIMLGDGAGNFTYSAKVASGRNWMMAAGDVNGDGHVDVVSAGGQDSNITVATGNGSGGFASVSTFAGDEYLVAVDLGDVDGDGDLDVAFSAVTSTRWSLYENDGSGTFPIAPIYYSAVVQASCVIFHDRDNDGDLDMTTIDEGSDLLQFYDNDGAVLSVELTNFDVLAVGDDLMLSWTTAMEVDNAGFYVERTFVDTDEWVSVGFVEGNGSTTQSTSYSYSVKETNPGRYRFRLRQVDFDGTTELSNEIVVVIPGSGVISLSPVYPNPFTSSASFDVLIPNLALVDIQLYNILGQSVRTIYSGYLSGLDRHPFTVDADGLPAGMYVLRVSSSDRVVTSVLTLAR